MRIANVLILLVTCLLASSVLAQSRLATESSVGLLEGLDSLSGNRLSTCASGSPAKPVNRDNVSLSVDYVVDAEAVYRSVETNASAQFGVGIGQKVSVSFGMSTEQFFSRQSTVLAIDEKVTTVASVSSGPYSIDAKYMNLDDDKFRQQCGTEFVTEVVQGGQFIALLRAENISQTEKDQYKADLNVSLAGDDGSASYRSARQRIASNTSFHLHLVRIGAQGDLPALTPLALIDYARTFLTAVRASGNPVFVQTAPYSAAGRTLSLDLGEKLRESVLYGLAAQFDWGHNLYTQIDRVLRDSGDYAFKDKALELDALEKAGNLVSDFVTAIVTSATDCLDKRKNNCVLSMIKPGPQVNLPPRLDVAGGCYVWTVDNHYCVDYTIRGASDTTMEFSAPMKPGSRWHVRAFGDIFPATSPPDLGNVNTISITIALEAAGQHGSDGRVFRHWEQPLFDANAQNVVSSANGLTGRLTITQCFWVGAQRCQLDGMRVRITDTPIPTVTLKRPSMEPLERFRVLDKNTKGTSPPSSK